MAHALPRKALIAVSSYTGAIFPDGTKTGVFFTEALHPFQVFTAAGFDVEVASETGEFGYDEFSLTPAFLAGSDRAAYEDDANPFMAAMRTKLKAAAGLAAEEYGVVFASAGHSALYDYPSARGLQRLVEGVYARGGVVGATCHGPVLFTGAFDGAGRSIIAGKTVTGFATEGEQALGILARLRQDGVRLVPEAVIAAGADYSSPFAAFDDYSIASSRIVTGANPASARSAAERIVRSFDSTA